MKKISLLLALTFLIPVFQAQAKDEYIYRKRVNWVKITKAKPKDVPVGQLQHPYQDVSTVELEAMLSSIQINRRFVLSKKMKTNEVFNSYEARLYAPFIVAALAKATPDQVVHFSVVHKRPIFILRNDHISMGHVWVDSQGMHVKFDKLFAQIDGDYEQAANMNKQLRKAKSLRVSLEAGPGQKLSYDSLTEIIFDTNHNFVSEMVAKKEAEAQSEEDYLVSGKKKNKNVSGSSRPITTNSNRSTTERLQELKNLKDQKLISQQEFEVLRKKILEGI